MGLVLAYFLWMCSNHLACRIYALGSAILFGTSFPSEMRSGVALIGFILGSVLIAVGLGGVQASVQPFIGRMPQPCVRPIQRRPYSILA
jgi:dipeptide/tripeptide permease